jgi:hypothetical protein
MKTPMQHIVIDGGDQAWASNEWLRQLASDQKPEAAEITFPGCSRGTIPFRYSGAAATPARSLTHSYAHAYAKSPYSTPQS